jgi:hypothetical protein
MRLEAGGNSPKGGMGFLTAEARRTTREKDLQTNSLSILSLYSALHCYPKTKTNMFVIACRLYFLEVEGSRIRIFLAPRRKGAKFEGEREIFL